MTIYTEIDANKRKTWLLVVIFVAVVGFVGYVFGEVMGYGLIGFGFALIFATFSSVFSYYYSDKVALSLSKAKKIEEQDNPRLYRTVENLCIGAGLPMPSVHIIADPALNAFATGRDPEHAAIAVTTGLLEKLDKLELEGVIAHELSHVRNYDIRLMTIVVVLVGTIAIIADVFLRSLWFGGGKRDRNRGGAPLLLIGLVFAVLSPIIAQLIKQAISRKREYLADASGALLTRYPEGLASALEKISASNMPLSSANSATAHLFIANPLKKDSFHRLFSTHPPVEKRIRKLRAM